MSDVAIDELLTCFAQQHLGEDTLCIVERQILVARGLRRAGHHVWGEAQPPQSKRHVEFFRGQLDAGVGESSQHLDHHLTALDLSDLG